LRRTLLAALLALIMPKPIAAMPITCIGMKPTVAELAPFQPTCQGMTTQMLGMMQRSRGVDLSALFLCTNRTQNGGLG
jgi:hypothetical protein